MEKMHSAHSRVSNLAAFIAEPWDLCFFPDTQTKRRLILSMATERGD